jgi:hypothetical protein
VILLPLGPPTNCCIRLGHPIAVRQFARVTVDVTLRASWWPIEVFLPRAIIELASRLSIPEQLRVTVIGAPQQSRCLLHERETFMPMGDSRFLVFCREIS